MEELNVTNEGTAPEGRDLTAKKAKGGRTVCNLEDFNYEVEVIDNPFLCNEESEKWVMGVLGGEEFFIQACSDRYELVKNVDIFPNIEKILIDNGIEFTADYSHTKNVRFYANYIITDTRFGYVMNGTNDRIQPIIRVQHSYNGLTKYKIVFGFYRLVCSNGMTIPVAEMSAYNLCITGKHTASILGSLEQLDNILKTFVNDYKEIKTNIVEKYEILGGRWVENVADRITEVLNENKISAIENGNFNTVQDILGRITREANGTIKNEKGVEVPLGYDGKVNDFLIYNGINAYLNDDKLNIAAPETRMEKDSRVFEWMLENAS